MNGRARTTLTAAVSLLATVQMLTATPSTAQTGSVVARPVPDGVAGVPAAAPSPQAPASGAPVSNPAARNGALGVVIHDLRQSRRLAR